MHAGLTGFLVWQVDDPLDAVAVHGFCGMWGLISAGKIHFKRPCSE